MGEFVLDNESAFLDLVTAAQEIVLPGASGVRMPVQRANGGWIDVGGDCMVLTDGIPAYGSC